MGTDSHTTMINGLGVVGWGVGGIEAEACMLGQPISMLLPEVVGFKLHGRLADGSTATDLVLTVTQMLRKKGVVGKFVEFYGNGVGALTLADRATIGNMAPEYGATIGFFPIDHQTLDYLRLSNRPPELIALVEAYAKAQGLFLTKDSPEPETATQPSPVKLKNKQLVRVKATSSPNQVFSHQAELKISSTPDGAKVELDGWSEPRWVTPFRASNLAAGKHNVVLTKPGYMQEERDVEVAVGKSLAVDVALNPMPPKAVVSSTPGGANIWIDGKDTGKTTPAEINYLEKGSHTIVLRKQGFKEVSTSETLTDGQTLTYSPVLLANATIAQTQDDPQGRPGFWKRVFGGKNIPEGKGVIHVRTNPTGALIVHNGKIAPDRTDAEWPANPGTYDLELRKEGYKTIHRTIHVEKGKVTDVDELLEKLKQ